MTKKHGDGRSPISSSAKTSKNVEKIPTRKSICPFCKKDFSTSRGLSIHKTAKHGDWRSLNSRSAKTSENVGKMPKTISTYCPICKKGLCSLRGYKMHLAWRHDGHSGGIPSANIATANAMKPNQNIEILDVSDTGETTEEKNAIESKSLSSPLLKMFERMREKNVGFWF